MVNAIRNTMLAVIVAGLGAVPCTMAARANIVFHFSGACAVQCSGTATGVLTLSDSYVFGSFITAANFVSFSYTSSALNFTIPVASNLTLAGGLNADGSIFTGNTTGGLNIYDLSNSFYFFAAQNATNAFEAGVRSNNDAGISFAFTLFPPRDLISPDVPHDVPTGPTPPSIQDLAIFAWREFIALNWVAMDPATTGMRGRPNVNLGVNAGFLGIKPYQNGDFPLLVWHTYRHKNELFPANGQTDANFDSSTPTYIYNSPPTPGQVFPLMGPPIPGELAAFPIFNNLDETSEIGLCQMFAHSTIRVAYEAKVNRAVFAYADKNQLTNASENYSALTAATTKTKDNLAQYGGICSTDPSIVSLPCGDNAVAGDAGEGAIEIKAAWRQLTPTEAASGRFFTQTVLFYEGQPGNQTYNNAVYGLVALHIIHKTKSFPAFVFASWEQIDNYDDANNQNTEALAFNNLGYPNLPIPPFSNYPNNPPPPHSPPFPLTRNHAIHSSIPPVNDAVHAAFTKIDPQTVWQYYKLIGVQATPVNGPPSRTAPPDDLSYYYLANIVVETNQTLQNFAGSLPLITATPLLNVYLKGASGSPFQMGGCQGCHGAAGQSNGGDMSVLIGFGPSNAAGPPESIDNPPEASATSYALRSKGLVRR